MRAVLIASLLAGCDGCNHALPVDEEARDFGTRDLATGVGRDLASSCAGLDEAGCRAHKECVADYCTECSCTPTFVGCRAPADGKTTCPGTGCDPPLCCTTEKDCNPSGAFNMTCVPPGEFAGCGICFMGPTCDNDGYCPSDAGVPYNGPVCDDPSGYLLCGLCGGGKVCLPGCNNDGQCAGGRTCNASQHCVWKGCVTDGDCSATLRCDGGLCRRRPCATDADCPAGFCVESACYEGYGTCQPLPQ